MYDIDSDETFSLVAKMDSIRLELSIVTTKGWEVHQMDVKNEFLHRDLHGAAPGIYAGLIFGLSTEEVTLWPQAVSEGMVCQDGLLPVVTELCTL